MTAPNIEKIIERMKSELNIWYEQVSRSGLSIVAARICASTAEMKVAISASVE